MANLAKIERTGQSGLIATPEQIERARANIEAAKADNTKIAYDCDWRVWTEWADANGHEVMPAQPEAVALFLSDVADAPWQVTRTVNGEKRVLRSGTGRKVSTLRRYLSRISSRHTEHGQRLDLKHPAIVQMMRGIARRKSGDTRKVKPLTVDLLKAALGTFGDTTKDARDRALLALGVASGFRRSELAGLHWLDYGDGTGCVELTDDGAILWLRNSKASQDKPEQIFISAGIALEAVKRWVAMAEIEKGTPLFRSISKHGNVGPTGLTGGSIARVVKSAIERAGLEATEFSGHSLRAGMITTAAESDVPEWQIQMHSRHKTPSMVREYVRSQRLKEASPVRAMGL